MLREKQTGDSSSGNQTQQGGISFRVRNSVRETAQNHQFFSKSLNLNCRYGGMVTYSGPLTREFVLSVECCDIARYLRSPNDQAADVPYSHTSLQEVSCEIFTSF